MIKMMAMIFRHFATAAAFVVAVFAWVGSLPASTIAAALREVEQYSPSTVDDLRPERTEQLVSAAEQLDAVAGDAVFRGQREAQASLRMTRELLATHDAVEATTERALALRLQLLEVRDEAQQRAAIRQYLKTSAALIDLSGRLRYLLRDAIGTSAALVRGDRATRLKLIDTLIERKSGIGAGVAAPLLLDDATDDWTKAKVLQLIAVAQECDLLPQVVQLIRGETTSPGLRLLAGETVRYVGLPQTPHPQQAKDTPAPAITADELLARLSNIDALRLSERGQARLRELTTWLEERKAKGIAEEGYRFFGHTVREGDWFLMRNPSPYNMFTDLSPGLFTHVGVVTSEVDDHGVRRFVIVDLPERSETVPVTNVDAYVLRTLNYVFLRHNDRDTAIAMGDAARAMMGNPARFDLNFRTDRIAEYRGKPLADATIHTYCAGFLLLCSQASGRPREDFFPIIEYPAGGRTQANLKTLGLSLGEDFVSPTAALFSSSLEIVGRRRPMYDPQREVQEAVYDHFAQQMNTAVLTPSPSAQQALREKLVQISDNSPWLRRAIAKANGVNDEMDLLSAARAAAVVETLDEIAESSADDFAQAREAFLSPPNAELQRRGIPTEKGAQIMARRRQHAELYENFRLRRITPPQLQQLLVQHYSESGRRRLDERFFTSPSQR